MVFKITIASFVEEKVGEVLTTLLLLFVKIALMIIDFFTSLSIIGKLATVLASALSLLQSLL